MRILITDSSGQLGTEVARQLASTHEPIGIDMTPGEQTQHVIDIRDRAATIDIDAIIHIASLHQRYFPNIEAMFTQRHWQLPARIDRIYVTAKAERCLGYHPLYNFEEFLSQSRATDTSASKPERRT